MSYGTGNSYNRGYENVKGTNTSFGTDFQYKSYQNGYRNEDETIENRGQERNGGNGGNGGLFQGIVDVGASYFRVRKNSKQHDEINDINNINNINNVLHDTIATNYNAQGTANETLNTMVKQREQVRARRSDGMGEDCEGEGKRKEE